MKTKSILIGFLFICCSLMVACNTTPTKTTLIESDKIDNTLYVYQDGRMQYKSRFINDDDVIIYPDGRGGERAAIKVRVPIHPDFFRDSIVVVRVVNKFDDAVAQTESESVNQTN